jgi:hypothetical protein
MAGERVRNLEAGQAATEYALVAAALVIGAVLAGPGAAPYLDRLLDALDAYYRSIYTVLALPLP